LTGLIAETRVRCWAILFEIYGGERRTRAGFSPSTTVSSCQDL